jgi:hypothetical protein
MMRAKAARRRGLDALLYLNRFEGFDPRLFDALDPATRDRLDTMPDSTFQRLFPQARHSLLVLTPHILSPVRSQILA